MFKTLSLFFFAFMLMGILPSCNHNKIACPTYADSFPDAKKKKSDKPNEPQLPKATKARSSVMPGGTPRPR